MSHYLHQALFYIHVFIGAIALVVFWLPLAAKKGSAKHVLYGKIFANGMYAVSVSGLVMSCLVLIDPIAVRLPTRLMDAEQIEQFILRSRISAGFLLMLSVLVFTSVSQSILVLKAKANRQLMKTPSHLGQLVLLGVLGLLIGVVGTQRGILLFQIFALLCIVNSVSMLHYIFKASIKQREWILVHLGNILGAGIGAYTAFFAFGGSRLFAEFLSGSLMVLPWVLPGIIGGVASFVLTKKYAKQYRVA